MISRCAGLFGSCAFGRFTHRPPAFAREVDRLARLEREARALASIDHPNIATLHGVEDGDGVLALVLGLVDGDTLRARLVRERLPP